MTGRLDNRTRFAATDALERIGRMLLVEPLNTRLLVQRAQCLLALGRWQEAREAACAVQRMRPTDSVVLDAIGGVFSRASDQTRALGAYDQAVALAPGDPHFRFNRAAVRRFVGDLDGAEADYDRVIELRRHDYEAYLNRSELRPQTRESNHTAELEALLDERQASWSGEVALHYALGKEYEDLGEYKRAFAYLERGAELRRKHMHYDVSRDVATVEWIIQAYPGTKEIHASPNASQAAPIFIVGLPRSGSTLVERILAGHSQVRPGGELPHFALALAAATHRLTGQDRLARQALIAHSARVDFPSLGWDYLARVRSQGIDGRSFTDKMPLNYLYCGLIRRALPNARIVHVTRHPMAACYAIYKTLFQDGYPFSYDRDELGRYYVAYRRLMRHWAETLPGVIHEMRYEDLVRDVRGEARRLLEFCGLDWQEACAEFHNNRAPTTTASASQVRRPLYDTSISQWRHYRDQLAPLEQQLRAAGFGDV